jgi:MFS family permease
LWLTERAGLRVSLLWGYASGLACAVLAHLACALPLAPRAGFRLLYLSQALGAVGQPLYLNNVTLLAGAWFSASERDAAVAVSLLCVSFGSVFISAYAPLVVTTSSQVDLLFWWQVPIWIVIVGVALVFTADQPALPPNPAAAVQRATRRAAAKRRSFGAEDDTVAAVTLTWRQVVQLCSNQNFNILNLSSSIVVSTIYLVGTVAGQLLSPCGVSNFVVGLSLAAAALFTGIAVIAYIFILRRTTTHEATNDADAHAHHHAVETAPHPYKAHQVGWSLLAAAAIVPVLATATIGISPVAVVTAWAALGLLSGTLVNGALTMEHAAEITFPLPANVSVNVLAITGSLISFVQVVIGTLLLEMPASATCSRVDTPFALFCFLNAAGGLALLAFLRPDYRRAEVEARVQRVADQRAAREEAEGGAGKGGVGAGYGAMRPLSSSGT